MSHNIEQVIVQLTDEEVHTNIIKAQETINFLIRAWKKRDIIFEADDISIPIITQRIALKCSVCGLEFESEDAAEDDACEFSTDPVSETGVDAWYDINQPKAEVVNMYGYSAEIGHQDLTLIQIYLRPEFTANGMESEGYYAGGDIAEIQLDSEPEARGDDEPDYVKPKYIRPPRVKREKKEAILKMLAISKANELAEAKRKKGRDEVKYKAYAEYIEDERYCIIAKIVLDMTAQGVNPI